MRCVQRPPLAQRPLVGAEAVPAGPDAHPQRQGRGELVVRPLHPARALQVGLRVLGELAACRGGQPAPGGQGDQLALAAVWLLHAEPVLLVRRQERAPPQLAWSCPLCLPSSLQA